MAVNFGIQQVHRTKRYICGYKRVVGKSRRGAPFSNMGKNFILLCMLNNVDFWDEIYVASPPALVAHGSSNEICDIWVMIRSPSPMFCTI